MKNRYFVTFITLGIIAGTTGPAWAQVEDCDTFFVQVGDDNAWQNPDNWVLRVPLSTDVACIVSGQEAIIYHKTCSGGSNNPGQGCTSDDDCVGGTCDTSPPVQVGAVILLGDPAEWEYNIRVSNYATLVLNGHYTCQGGPNQGDPCTSPSDCEDWPCVETTASRLTGRLHVERTATLEIANDLTIEGNGGILEGEYFTTDDPARIVGTGRLTLRGDNPGFTCDAGDRQGESCYPDRICRGGGTCGANGKCVGGSHPGENCDCPGGNACTGSLMVTEVWRIEVKLENDAVIMASHPDGITLTGAKKTGSGLWSAFPADGLAVLVVECEVDGDGTWALEDTATIRIEPGATCTNLTGDVNLSAGTFEVNADFDTTGDVNLSGGELQLNQDFYTDGNLVMTGGRITLASGKYAMFGY